MTGPVPEGWYADPQATAPGTERWWNGVQWTAHTRAAPQPSTQPSTASDAAGDRAGAGGPRSTTTSEQVLAGLGGEPRYAEDGERLAGALPRLCAWVIDLIAVSIVGSVLGWGLFLTGTLVAGATDLPRPDLDVGLGWLTGALTLLVRLAYETWFVTRSGSTPGKQVLHLVVRPAAGAGPVGPRPALARAAAGSVFLLSPVIGGPVGLVGLVGLLRLFVVVDAVAGLSHPRLQTLHDRAAATVVVTREARTAPASRVAPPLR